MNAKGAPADPLREALAKYDNGNRGPDMTQEIVDAARAALAIKPAETPTAERLRAQGINPETFLPRHPTESAGKSQGPSKRLQRQQIYAAGYAKGQADMAGARDAKAASGHPAQAVASAVQRPADEDRALSLLRAIFGEMDENDGQAPGHMHSRRGVWDDDNGAKAGTVCQWCRLWNDARTYLADTQRSSPTAGSDEHPKDKRERHIWASGWQDGYAAGSDEAKDRGAPLGSEPATVWKIDWPEEQDEEPSYTENPNIAELARKMGRTVTAFAALASPPAGEKE